MVSASVAPVALIGGWTLAASRQGPGYNAVRDTISALAARDATDAWVMTTGLAVLGACHVATAIGLTEAGTPARVLLGVGGAATMAVAALPQPSTGHVPAAAVGFIALAVWPAAARVPQRSIALGASAGLVALLGWLAIELRGGSLLGLSERVLAGAQSLWPLAVAIVLIRRAKAR
jgi:hypothetical membrane protein